MESIGTFSLTSVTTSENKEGPINPQEEKRLVEVFNLLSNYSAKTKLKQEADELKTWIEQYKQKIQAIYDATGIKVTAADINYNEEKFHRTSDRLNAITEELRIVESDPDRKISSTDVFEVLKVLGKKVSKKEVEEMVWEVDEDLDGHLNWFEFRLMFVRNLADMTGLEPSRMHNLAQFLIYDKNMNGKLSVDETMGTLYARYGMHGMEDKLTELFGQDMHESRRQVSTELTFPDYLSAVEAVQLRTYWASSRGQITAKKTVGKKKK